MQDWNQILASARNPITSETSRMCRKVSALAAAAGPRVFLHVTRKESIQQ
jgi:hypothetical protein